MKFVEAWGTTSGHDSVEKSLATRKQPLNNPTVCFATRAMAPCEWWDVMLAMEYEIYRRPRPPVPPPTRPRAVTLFI